MKNVVNFPKLFADLDADEMVVVVIKDGVLEVISTYDDPDITLAKLVTATNLLSMREYLDDEDDYEEDEEHQAH
jgi:hypothetical protein